MFVVNHTGKNLHAQYPDRLHGRFSTHSFTDYHESFLLWENDSTFTRANFFSHHFAMPRHHVTKASLRPSYQFTVWKVVWEKPGPRLPHWVYTGERYMVWAQSQVTHRTVKSKRMIKTLKKVASKIRVSIYFGKHLFEEFVFFPIVDRGVRRWFIFVSDQ